MKYLNKLLLFIIPLIVFGLIFSNEVYAQTTVENITASGFHNMGIYMQDVASPPGNTNYGAYYPNGHHRSRVSWYGGMWLFVKNLIDTEGGSARQANFETLGQGEGSSRIGSGFEFKYREDPPAITVDGVLLSPPFRGVVDPTIECDIKIIAEVTLFSSMGGVFTNISRSYANQYHNSYVLWDLNYKFSRQIDYDPGEETYLPEQTIDCYIAQSFGWGGAHPTVMTYNPRYRETPGFYNFYRCVNWHAADIFPSAMKAAGKITGAKATRDNLDVSYSFGVHQTRAPKPRPKWSWTNWSGTYSQDFENDYGAVGNETDPINGELTNYMYEGHTTFHADKSVTDVSDDIAKPRHLGWLSMTKHLWGSWPKNFYDWADEDGLQTNDWELGYDDNRAAGYYAVGHSIQTIGPYSMSDGDEVNTVYASAVGGIAPEIAWEAGNDYLTWYRDGTGDMDNAKMHELCETGMDSLLQNLDRAYFCYSKNFNIPDPPWVPDIEVTSGPDKINVKWGYSSTDYFKDPDTGTDDFGEWRVYRKLGNILVNSTEDKGKYHYELVHTQTSKDVTEWDDTGVIKGESYHYYVTCVDDGSQYNSVGGIYSAATPLESSPYINRSLSPARSFEPGADNSDEVLIVPNPYSVGGRLNVMNYTGYPDDIHFVNLPAYCTLKIYTATGDLVKTIEHTTGSSQEIWSDMRTDSNQQPVAGVYILVVENARDLNNVQLSKRFYKFVIVR
ncbi:hypothetical protein KAS50_02425 [bacterium]|nr:hypothetical protein [bacterium]